MEKAIIIQDIEAAGLEHTDMACFEYAAKKFKEVHNLDFKPEQILDGTGFNFLKASNDSFFKIVYVGEGNEVRNAKT